MHNLPSIISANKSFYLLTMKPWAPSQDKQQDIGRQTLHLVVLVSTRLLQHFHCYSGGESLQAGRL